MDELVVKKNFADIYTQKFPDDYLEEMKRLHYRIPDKTKTLNSQGQSIFWILEAHMESMLH
jgi:hypothetical protein